MNHISGILFDTKIINYEITNTSLNVLTDFNENLVLLKKRRTNSSLKPFF